MFLEYQITILEWFHKNNVTLKIRVTLAKMKLCRAGKKKAQYYYCFDCIFECPCHQNDPNILNSSVHWDSSQSWFGSWLLTLYWKSLSFWNPSGENECFHNNCKTWADTVMLTSAVFAVLKNNICPNWLPLYVPQTFFSPKFHLLCSTEESQSY